MGGNTGPVVHLYALNWNERPLLPFFFEHYRRFVDQFFIFDDRSDDGSLEYLAAQPDVTLGSFVRDRDGFVSAAAEFNSNIWKASRGTADWVTIVNIDEFLHHPAPKEALGALRDCGTSVVRAVGWEMVATEFPETGPLATTVPNGVRDRMLDKIALFDPDAVAEINYAPGRHLARPSGNIGIIADNCFDLLHYKHLGFAYLSRRYGELNARRGERDVQKRWGVQYEQGTAALDRHFESMKSGARTILLENMLRAGTARSILPGCYVIRLRHSSNERGGLREVWTQGESWARDVRHVYLTTTYPGVVKAWYRHRRQKDQVTVVSGAVRFVLVHPGRHKQGEPPAVVELSADKPEMLIVPPWLWHGFKALGDTPAILLHANDMPFNWLKPDEERQPLESFNVAW